MKGCKKMAIFTNQAQLRYGNAVANSNVAVGEILEVLAATKTAVRKTYGQNDRVTYVVSIVNSGNTAMTGLTVADDLGAYAFGTDTLVPLTYVADTVRYYSNGILQTTPAVTAGPPLSVSGISVPAGGNVTIVYEAETNAFAPLLAESEITNTVTVSGGGITPGTAKETAIAEADNHQIRQSGSGYGKWNTDLYVPYPEYWKYCGTGGNRRSGDRYIRSGTFESCGIV